MHWLHVRSRAGNATSCVVAVTTAHPNYTVPQQQLGSAQLHPHVCYLRSLPSGAMTSLILKYSAAFQYAACAEGPTTISGAMMPLCATMESRDAFTASRMLSVPPGGEGVGVGGQGGASGSLSQYAGMRHFFSSFGQRILSNPA